MCCHTPQKHQLLTLCNNLQLVACLHTTQAVCSCPAGIVPTKFASALVENDELREQQRTANLLKRLGTPQDMAAAVAYLCSDDASYVTAETVCVSGGLQSRL